MAQFKPKANKEAKFVIKNPDVAKPTIQNIRQLKGEIQISNDDLREVLLCFLSKLPLQDLWYCLLTMEEEYGKKKYHRDIAA